MAISQTQGIAQTHSMVVTTTERIPTEMGRTMSEIVAYGTAHVVEWETASSDVTGAR